MCGHGEREEGIGVVFGERKVVDVWRDWSRVKFEDFDFEDLKHGGGMGAVEGECPLSAVSIECKSARSPKTTTGSTTASHSTVWARWSVFLGRIGGGGGVGVCVPRGGGGVDGRIAVTGTRSVGRGRTPWRSERASWRGRVDGVEREAPFSDALRRMV